MPMPAREITGNEIKPGATLAPGHLRGRLVYTASTLGTDKRGPCVQFSIAKALDESSDYVAEARGGNRTLTWNLFFALFCTPGTDDAAMRKQMEADLALLRDTLTTPQRKVTIDCTGIKVLSRELADDDSKTNRITVMAYGPRTLVVQNTERVFVQPPKPLQENSVWFNSPSLSPGTSIASRPLARTNSKDMRPVTEHQRPHLELIAASRQALPSRGAAAHIPTNNKGKGRAIDPGPTRTSTDASIPTSRPHRDPTTGGGGGRIPLTLGIASFDQLAPAPPSTPDAIESVPSSSIEEVPAPHAPTAAFDRREQLRLARAEEERLERERALQEVQARMVEEAGPSKKRRIDERDPDWGRATALAEFERPPVVDSSLLRSEQPADSQERDDEPELNPFDLNAWDIPREDEAVGTNITRADGAAQVGIVMAHVGEQPPKRPRQEVPDAEDRRKRLEAQARSDAEANARKAAEERLALQHEATRAAEAQTHLLETELHTGTYVYTPLGKVVDGSFANVLGVIVDAKEPKHPRHGSGSEFDSTGMH
ncbi:uncharacterized protein LOC62_01G001300 [Vanrija pseudolonga]|uniref:Uncharacterized protein n=1 Tax=Vanrija pseudolonga TaxID=143232 RepID=A0AAF0Y0I6_9TREE|nr:hypothetical protein LOC62_01G001300 [Vanrija pseudolonga]